MQFPFNIKIDNLDGPEVAAFLEEHLSWMRSSARRLYAKAGFKLCPPFADYIEDPNSVFMTMEL